MKRFQPDPSDQSWTLVVNDLSSALEGDWTLPLEKELHKM